MRVNWSKVNDRKMYLEEFDSYLDFLNTVESRKVKHKEYALENAGNRREFQDVRDYKEARELFLFGWDKASEKIKTLVDKEVAKLMSERTYVRRFSDVVGFAPIVPNALKNLPICMINQKNDTKKQKVVKFLIDIDVSASVDSDEMTEYFSKVVARIAVLEKMGYRCRIEIFESYSYPGEKKMIITKVVKVKSENQLFDIKRMSFAISHVAMFRVFGFAWYDSLPFEESEYWEPGFGRPLNKWYDEKAVKKVIDNTIKVNEKVVYISYGDDLDKIFGKEVK